MQYDFSKLTDKIRKFYILPKNQIFAIKCTKKYYNIAFLVENMILFNNYPIVNAIFNV